MRVRQHIQRFVEKERELKTNGIKMGGPLLGRVEAKWHVPEARKLEGVDSAYGLKEEKSGGK